MMYQIQISSPYTHYNFKRLVPKTSHYVLAKSISEEINKQVAKTKDTLSISKESLVKFQNMKREML